MLRPKANASNPTPIRAQVASAMLRAMEADYRACIESEARLAATETSAVGFAAAVEYHNFGQASNGDTT